ncbi:hypothetical protein AB0C31_08125, partial [Actinoplanes philippinensis]
ARGWSQWRPPPPPPLFFWGSRGAPPGPPAPRDEITELPAGAVLLAASSRYPHQAFRIGDRAWGLQFHIECDAEMIADWARSDSDGLAELGYDADAVVAAAGAALADVEEVWQPFAVRFAALARGTLADADIPNPGTGRTLPLLGQ